MEFFVLAVASATPEDLFLPSPVPVQALAGSSFQAPLPALERNLVVFLGSARLVGAEEHRNVRAWQLCTWVELRDLRVVPGLDGAVEDLGERLGVQDELIDAVDVVREGDRPTTIGRFQAALPWQRSLALSASMTPSSPQS
jgi:hypothetical protein